MKSGTRYLKIQSEHALTLCRPYIYRIAVMLPPARFTQDLLLANGDIYAIVRNISSCNIIIIKEGIKMTVTPFLLHSLIFLNYYYS